MKNGGKNKSVAFIILVSVYFKVYPMYSGTYMDVSRQKLHTPALISNIWWVFF